LFDSKKEAKRYKELLLLERAGKIAKLELQKEYELIPAQRDMYGKVIERAVKYKADFVYTDISTPVYKLVVEDTKGVKTKEYIIKRKLMLYKYGIRITEV
jgi:hypothetical protein